MFSKFSFVKTMKTRCATLPFNADINNNGVIELARYFLGRICNKSCCKEHSVDAIAIIYLAEKGSERGKKM